MKEKSTKPYIVEFTDTFCPRGQVTISAVSATEAVMIARRLAYKRDINIQEFLFPFKGVPCISLVEGTGLPFSFSVGDFDDCLSKHLDDIARAEGLGNAVVEMIRGKYENDRPEFF